MTINLVSLKGSLLGSFEHVYVPTSHHELFLRLATDTFIYFRINSSQSRMQRDQ